MVRTGEEGDPHRAWHEDPTSTLVVGLLVFALAVRLLLPEATSSPYVASNVVALTGGVLVALGWGRIGWASMAVGLAIPFALGLDWLSQTVVLLTLALTGVVAGTPGALVAARWLAPALYLVAGFHKLNRDYLDPTFSCATHGVERLIEVVPALAPLASLGAWAPSGIAACELAIGVMLLRRHRWGPAAAALFHLPLTLALAPVFAFSAMPLWVATLRPAERAAWCAAARRPRVRWVAFGVWALTATALLGTVDLGEAATSTWRGLLLVARCGLLPLFAVMTLLSTDVPIVARDGAAGTGRRWQRRVGGAAALLWVLWCMQPYVGVRMQHTAAMLSNLRVDRGCWNHLIVPERVRVRDPYIRVERVRFQNPEALRSAEGLERTITATLWHSAQLPSMRANWCTPRVGAIELRGTWMGAPFVLDVCDASEALPPPPPLIRGLPAPFPRMLRFQKNLPRDCPRACVH